MHFVIIEDHALIFESLSIHILRRYPNARNTHLMEVNLEELLGLLPIDCIFFDPNLGDGNRYERLGLIKDRLPDVPVIVLSADLDPGAGQKARAFGASAFIRKEKTSETLDRIFELVLNEGQQVFPKEDEMGVSQTDIYSDTSTVLTVRERDVIRCLVDAGLSNSEMAKALGISQSTIKFHLGNAFKKLGVSNRTEAILLLKGGPFEAQRKKLLN